jgi:7,8-dihydropterin-6-yl-methyl-4-(beta-D-ribofuranosyl)aminobenzene 5'-phosphate synthase
MCFDHHGAVLPPVLAASSTSSGGSGPSEPIETGHEASPRTLEGVLLEVDEVTVQIIVDNSIDLLMASSPVARRFPVRPDAWARPLPVAEHGFSVLVTAKRGERSASILFDAGVSARGLLHNLDALEVDLAGLQAVVLSHGHADHCLGLTGLVQRMGARKLPLLLHPDGLLERKVVLPNGVDVGMPPPRLADLRREGIEPILEVGPSLLVEGMILLSGEVPRRTPFEKGFPIHFARRDGAWAPDPLILDDQCAIVNVAGKGLVVVTGCGHSGIINILHRARELTGTTKIYGVIGGFHLTGGIFEPIIDPTVEALKEMAPTYVVPGHCTGWKATHRLAAAMPEAFVQNSVGTTLAL